MIIDQLTNLHKYAGINPLFDNVVRFITEHDLNQLPEGKHTIVEGEAFVNITRTAGKTHRQAALEYHRKMIDIQVPLTAEETFGYTPTEQLPQAPFDEAKDIAKLPGVTPQTYVKVAPGQMAVFFPQDGHAPCISEAADFKKAIFKIKA